MFKESNKKLKRLFAYRKDGSNILVSKIQDTILRPLKYHAMGIKLLLNN
jgi:hypothetical protein